MSELEAMVGDETEVCVPSGYEQAIMKVVTTAGEITVLTYSRTSKKQQGDCSEGSEQVATSSTGGDSTESLCMSMQSLPFSESEDCAQSSANVEVACKEPESHTFKGFSVEEQLSITTELLEKLETIVALHSGRQKIEPDVQRTGGILLEESPRDLQHSAVSLSPKHTLASVAVVRPRLVQAPKRFLDGEGIRKPTRRASCTANLPPVPKDKNLFQMGLLPPKHPKLVEASPSGLLYSGPGLLPEATCTKRGSKNQLAFGGLFEISYLLESGELEKLILEHQMDKMANNLHQQNLREVPFGVDAQLKQNSLEKCRTPVMEVVSFQSATSLSLQKQVDCTASTLHLMTNSNKTYSSASARYRKAVPALLNYSPLSLSTRVVASHDNSVPPVPNLIALERGDEMSSTQQDAFQTVRKPQDIPPLIMLPKKTRRVIVPKTLPKLTAPKKMPKVIGEPRFGKRIPKIPMLTGKTFQKGGMATQLSLLSRKLDQNSKFAGINEPQSGPVTALSKTKEIFPQPPVLKPYGIYNKK